MPNIPEGQIKIDSIAGRCLGFTSDLFSLDSYLWKIEKVIWISLIFSNYPGKGNFKKLIQNIFDLGYTVKVPTAFRGMKQILTKWGFEQEVDLESGCEVWIKGEFPE